jgi:flagellar biosynthesis protein FlhB
MSSDDSSQSDKHLPASEQRLQRAREDGQVARSRDLASFVLLGVACVGFAVLGTQMFGQMTQLVASGLSVDTTTVRDPARMTSQLASLAGIGLLAAAPLLGGLYAVAILSSVLVGGWNFTVKALELKWDRIDPIAGVGRMFSKQGLAESGKVLLFVALLAAVLTWIVWESPRQASDLANMSINSASAGVGNMLLSATLALVVVLFLIAAIDVPLQVWKHSSNLRMSVDEVKRESKESDGDPQLKAKIRAVQRRVAQQRMMAQVPTADVVITNPTHYSVAIQYSDATNGAPRVVAKGVDLVALRIREIAAEHQVPVMEAPALARALFRHTEIDEQIPAALYQAVAQVLAYVFQLRHSKLGTAPVPEAPTEITVPKGLDPAEATQ